MLKRFTVVASNGKAYTTLARTIAGAVLQISGDVAKDLDETVAFQSVFADLLLDRISRGSFRVD